MNFRRHEIEEGDALARRDQQLRRAGEQLRRFAPASIRFGDVDERREHRHVARLVSEHRRQLVEGVAEAPGLPVVEAEPLVQRAQRGHVFGGGVRELRLGRRDVAGECRRVGRRLVGRDGVDERAHIDAGRRLGLELACFGEPMLRSRLVAELVAHAHQLVDERESRRPLERAEVQLERLAQARRVAEIAKQRRQLFDQRPLPTAFSRAPRTARRRRPRSRRSGGVPPRSRASAQPPRRRHPRRRRRRRRARDNRPAPPGAAACRHSAPAPRAPPRWPGAASRAVGQDRDALHVEPQARRGVGSTTRDGAAPPPGRPKRSPAA